jgi:4-amino-4-deoxy-L-arabinose transferase-like glycosyltransferase
MVSPALLRQLAPHIPRPRGAWTRDAESPVMPLPAQDPLDRRPVQTGIPPRLFFLFLLLCATSLRFIALGRQSLWCDELFSVFWAKAGVAFALSHAAQETNPPLYYLLLNPWMSLFGESESAVRLLSACASALTVAVTYFLGRRLFNETAGFIAACLLALSPLHLYFAQEARAFALFDLGFACLLFSLVVLIGRLGRGTSARDAIRSLPALGIVISSTACAYLHFVSFMMFTTVGGVVAVIWWRNFACSRAYFLCFGALGAAIAVLTAPSFALALAQRHSPSVSWMSFPTITKLLGLVTGTPAWTAAPAWILGGVIVVSMSSAFVWAALFLRGWWCNRKTYIASIAFLLPVLGFCLLTAVSLKQPFLFTRTTLWMSIPLYAGLGGTVAGLRGGTARLCATAILILTACSLTGGYFALSSKEPWRTRVASYRASMGPADLLILDSDTPAMAIVYYSGQSLVPILRRWPDNRTTADRLDQQVTGIRTITGADIAKAAEAGTKILFVSRGSCTAPKALTPEQTDLIVPDQLHPCNGRPLSGTDLIRQFARHIAGGTP